MAIHELRVALTTNEFERMVQFLQEGLGMQAGELWERNGKGQMFFAERASLEIFDPEFAADVDQIEAGKKVTGQIRFAFQVDDLLKTLEKALQYGAKQVHEPVLTPWNDYNVRIESPDGIQITLYQTMHNSD